MGKIARAQNSSSNACRNIHGILKRTAGLSLPVDIETFALTVKKKRPMRIIRVWWPMISLRQWVRYFLDNQPGILLGGHGLGDVGYQYMLETFWRTYQVHHGEHDVFRSGFNLRFCIPVMVHGDEGRGQCKVPLLVVSWQPVITFRGVDFNNDAARFGRVELC